MILHGFFRSTASWRVRIALALKGIGVDGRFHHLRRGDQLSAEYLAVNPQGLVPALELDDGAIITQSLAIIEYLDETWPTPPLLPPSAVGRAAARSIALAIACDVHPVQNLRVLGRVGELAGSDATAAWARRTIGEGLDAVERLIDRHGGRFCVGDEPSVADLCLVPQLGNARRFDVALVWPRIAAVERRCMELPAFTETAPDRQPDAE